ncbi:MAG TPA: 4'-phosphopantetheinyl transferase superfamily protein [Candidatus Limnocylindrales bacterium]|nr:4'-phosphopantetheinyl transferase superfamily protein [Candidatus Limnocylindrales bacterium]
MPSRSSGRDRGGGGVAFSVGVDVEDVARFSGAATNPRLRGLFAAGEAAHCEAFADADARFAGTWCAKEAAIKALWPWVHLDPRRVTVAHAPDGRPEISIEGWRLEDADVEIRVSVSHTPSVATASAIAWGPRPAGPKP